jgi:hypothetical protein
MLWGEEKSLAPPGKQTLFVQPEAYHHTDSVILAPIYVTGDTENTVFGIFCILC